MATIGSHVVDARLGENEAMPPAKASDLAGYERRYRQLLEQIAEVGFIRSGSVAPRYNYCGKPNCRCHADPPQPHGDRKSVV